MRHGNGGCSSVTPYSGFKSRRVDISSARPSFCTLPSSLRGTGPLANGAVDPDGREVRSGRGYRFLTWLPGTVSGVAVPIIFEGEARGVIIVESDIP
ncbi:MAG: hypothetical protein L0027_09790, partial [Candidatus Rokubacteria bacterium]|nr:hypothetical protein [Candidatus Rokubacteria bacterium]